MNLVNEYLMALSLNRAKPTVALLMSIVEAHMRAFPFSSIDCLLGRRFSVDLESVFAKIVAERRGGYCFEHNRLLFDVLTGLGFATRLVLARVLLSGQEHPPLTHRLTVVSLGGRDYVVDVGFGPSSPMCLVPLDGESATDRWRTFRIRTDPSGDYFLEMTIDGKTRALYRFELVRYGDSDCELGHFYAHRHPSAVHPNNLVVTLSVGAQIRSLRNLDYWVMESGSSRSEAVVSAEHLGKILRDCALDVSIEESREIFERVSSEHQ